MRESVGLREQKRAATRLAIEVAVLELTLEHGLAQVTVDEIGRVAQISPRTFFNYFASKEDALSGGHESFSASDEAVAAFVAGDDGEGHVHAVVTLLAASLVGRDENAGVHRLRREVFHRYPELLGPHIVNAKQLEREVTDIAEARVRHALARDRAAVPDAAVPDAAVPDAAVTDEQVVDRARLAVLVGFAIIRTGWMRWAAAEGRTPLSDCIMQGLHEFDAICSLDGGRAQTREMAAAAV